MCAVGKVCVILDFFFLNIIYFWCIKIGNVFALHYFFYFRTEIETAAILDKGRWVGTDCFT
jgi:hypothetical protein